MAQNDVVRARIDKKTKDEATLVLEAMGLTPSEAYRMLMIRIAREKALPFTPYEPNEETLAAMRETRDGNLATVGGIDDLFGDLDEND